MSLRQHSGPNFGRLHGYDRLCSGLLLSTHSKLDVVASSKRGIRNEARIVEHRYRYRADGVDVAPEMERS